MSSHNNLDSTLPTYNFVDRPSSVQIAAAKLLLAEQNASAANLQAQIKNSEDSLRQIVEDSQRAIASLEVERQELQKEIELTLAFISPIRGLPDEILREIFWYEFEIHPCCAWILAAVCSLWRRIVLKMPRIWSKIRLITTPESSPDTIRLWLERSGPNVPLDIEIYLQVMSSISSNTRGRPISPFRAVIPPPMSQWSPVLGAVDWHPPFPAAHVLPVIAGAGVAALDGTITPPLFLPPLNPQVQVHAHALQMIPTGAQNGNANANGNGNNNNGGPALPAAGIPPGLALMLGLHPLHGHNGGHAVHTHTHIFNAGGNNHAHHFVHGGGNGGVGPHSPPLNPFVGGGQNLHPNAHRTGSNSEGQKENMNRMSSHWGHIAMFYMVEQMPRWKRFVFKFEKQFSSMQALKSINGNAPLLEEFEVSCAEPFSNGQFHDWTWLPSSLASSLKPGALQKLKSVSLQYVPFAWSSPMLSGGTPAPVAGPSNLTLHSQFSLTSLSLRALASPHIHLDRLLHIISSNPALKHLSLNFQSVLPAVLPLSPKTLHDLEVLHFGGHYLLSTLLDALTLPSLSSFTLDFEPREPFEELITPLLTRSHNPMITHLSLSYNSAGHYYSGPALMGMAPWNFLATMNSITSLQIGHTSFDLILNTLANVDEDSNTWFCPNLTKLALKSCSSHGDGISKLVSMVEARNPSQDDNANENGGAVAGGLWGVGVPAKLKTLEIYDCALLGDDILRWLRSRIIEVRFSEPIRPRSPLSPPYGYL